MTAVDVAFDDEGVRGDTVPVLLSASLGTTRTMWAEQVHRLAATRRVIAYDHRGHGDSPVPADDLSLTDLVDDVVALLDRLDVAQVDVVGVSLGGTVGLGLATARPDRVRTLVTINSPVFADAPDFWRQRAAAVRAQGMGVASAGLLGRWYSPTVAAAPSALVRDTVDTVDRLSPAGYAACCAAIAGTDLREALPALAVPLLAVTGSADAVVPAHHAELLADSVPGARRVEVAGAGHLLPQERPDELHALLTQHWTTTSTRSTR
ncbi:alpha/beta fold hydrolase [uncultured Modestobacter sp.]|uniref:alpha/beta fold hydrolase n=1 Tax=uncultured Modestobacter sp. TaxID=380048 RepID=UPI00262E34D3|nr:alpha/beta fold hydrolase [uncultured Modestobacter sp.]